MRVSVESFICLMDGLVPHQGFVAATTVRRKVLDVYGLQPVLLSFQLYRMGKLPMLQFPKYGSVLGSKRYKIIRRGSLVSLPRRPVLNG